MIFLLYHSFVSEIITTFALAIEKSMANITKWWM